MKSYKAHIKAMRDFAKSTRPNLRGGVEDASEEINEDEDLQNFVDTDAAPLDEEMDIEDTAEWEVVGVELPDVPDEDLVEELQEKLGTDPLSEDIREGEELVDEANAQVEVLNNLKDTATEKWDEYGDVSDEIAAVDAGIEQRIMRIPRSERTLAKCLEAIDEQIGEIEVGKATVEVAVVEKLVEHLTKKYSGYKAVPEKVRSSIQKAQDKRLKMVQGPDTEINSEVFANVDARGDLETYLDSKGENNPTLREVSNAYVEVRSTQVGSRVLAATTNSPVIIDSAVESIQKAHAVFTSQGDAREIFMKGFDMILDGSFTGDWETFSTVPFVKEMVEATREATAKMEQFPSGGTITQIEKVEGAGLKIAEVIETGLAVEQDEILKSLKSIEDALDNTPERIAKLEQDDAMRGEHLSSLLKDYVNNIRVLSQYIDEFCLAADIVVSIVEGHEELFSQLEKAAPTEQDDAVDWTAE